MEKYIIYWTIMVITQTPCDKHIKGEYINDRCYINDTIYIDKEMRFDSLDNAIRFHYILAHIQGRQEFIDEKFLVDIPNCPKVLIDTIWHNDFAEVYKLTKK